jgi:hypothetical protein
MKGTFLTIRDMGLGLKDIKTVTLTSESFDLEKLMEKDCINGLIMRNMMESGKTD